ncbi:MAG TPA: (2Fe-2S)-binding protein [Candidatus Limnocylindrales bacterium]|nr:(2Fe-2S)-binding protein [Candidatus Limnocylindrales bacterium]
MTAAAPTGAAPRLPIRLTVNGQAHDLEVEARRMLVDVLREDLDLTGTKVGCDTSQCGACTVHLDGRAVKACTVLAVQADGGDVTTIEAVAAGRPWGPGLEPGLHPMQAAFVDHHGLQCGFCTPGMIMSALDLVARTPEPTDGDIRVAIHGNLCRCTGYQSIVESIRAGAAAMAQPREARDGVAGS